jgi:hypothetical protein
VAVDRGDGMLGNLLPLAWAALLVALSAVALRRRRV